MGNYNNLKGTMNDDFSMGKGDNKVAIRTNDGVLEGKNNAGSFLPLLVIEDLSTATTTTWSSTKISDEISNADNITTGTLDDTILSSNVPLLDLENTFTDTNQFPRLGIGSVAFDVSNPEVLLIDCRDNGESVRSVGIVADNNNFIQMTIQNLSNGDTSSSDYVAMANNGFIDNNVIDMGINGSNYSANYVGGPNDGYLFTSGGNLHIGTTTFEKGIVFFTGGTDSYANAKMSIDHDGNIVSVGTITMQDGTELTHAVTLGQLNSKQDYLGDISGIVKGDGAGNYSEATAGTDYLTPNGDGSQLTNLSKSQVGLSNVTNDAQLKASQLDTDGTLSADSDTRVPSQKAVKTFVNAQISSYTNEVHMDICSSGQLTGGVITRNTTNLALFDVSAGTGYLKCDGVYTKVAWGNKLENICLGSTYTYVSIDCDGEIVLSATKQTSPEYINLGHVYLNTEIQVVVTIWNLPDIIGDYSKVNSNFIGSCMGTLVANGLNVSEQETPNNLYLNFSEGEFWINLSKFTTVNQTNFIKVINSADFGITLTYDQPNKVDTSHYNDSTQLAENALVEMTADYWKKDLLVMNPDLTPYMVFGDAEYATQDEAISAPLPLISSQILADGNAFLFTIICQKGDTSIANRLYDIRPMFQRVFGISNLASGGTVVDYNDLVNKPTIPTDTNQLTNGAGFVALNDLSASSPLSYSNTTGAFSISQSSNSQAGYLSATDWATFNSKLGATGDGSGLTGITAAQVGAIASGDTTVTKQGNTFNGVSQLIKTTAGGYIPALNGSLITDMTKSQVGLGNVANVDTTNASNISSGTLSDSRLSSLVTKQGNSFNGVSQLLQLNASGYIPALNGSLITNLSASQVGAVSSTLNSAQIIVGNSSNIASPVSMSGDATISNAGVLTVGSGAITTAKMANLGANTYLGNNTGSSASPSGVSTNTAFNQAFETILGNIKPIGIGAVGASNNIARADHVHPDFSITTTSTDITLSTHSEVHANPATSIATYLPLAASYTNKEYVIKNIGTGTVNVVATGSDTIDGRANIDLYVQNSLLKVKSNGTIWNVVGFYSPCASGYLFLGNTQGMPQAMQMSGDATISAAGVLTVSNNAISNSELAQATANTYKGNATGSTANVSDVSTNTAFNRNFETDTANIKTDGTVSVGASNNIARADHVHPVNNNRGNGSGTFIIAHNNGVAQSISSGGVVTKVTLSTEAQDSKGEFANSRFTSLSSQTVLVNATFVWDVMSNTTYRNNIIYIYKNGAEMYREQVSANSSTGMNFSSFLSLPVQMATNDYIEIYASTTNASARNITYQYVVIAQLY